MFTHVRRCQALLHLLPPNMRVCREGVSALQASCCVRCLNCRWTLILGGPGHTTAKTTTTMMVTFAATAKNAVNRSHTKLSFLHNGVQFVAKFLLIVYFRPVQLLRDVRFRRVVAMASFCFFVIIIPLNS